MRGSWRHVDTNLTKLSQHKTPLPRASTAFFSELEQAGTTIGLPPLGPALDDAKRLDLFSFMKSCLELCVHISPLVLLGDLAGKGYSVDSRLLIKVCSPVYPRPRPS